ncbi:NAD(P)-dependent dehydrogenase (short-subunit alcohol dehydrogenase family) [Arthrobacter sp. UYEF21]
MLINNAGANPLSSSLLDITEAEIQQNMETNFFGPVLLARAFAPILAAAPNPVLVDVHSVASWYAFGGVYSASKAALWSATNSFRLELAPQGVHVAGVHMGYVDTAMAAHAGGPKMTPADLVQAVYTAVEAGAYAVITDATQRVADSLMASRTLSREVRDAISYMANSARCRETVVESIDIDDKTGILVASVRPTGSMRNRCGICRRRCPKYDQGKGRRRWRAPDAGAIRIELEADAPRVACRVHRVTVAAVPWARHQAGRPIFSTRRPPGWPRKRPRPPSRS